MNPPIVFTNARMVLPDEVQTGSLSVEAGRIAGFGASNSSLPQAIDLEGDYLMPGFIEVHTDNFERHLMPRPKVQWAEMPALLAHDAEIAAAGITTVFDALGVGDADHESLRGTAWDAVLQTLDACTAENVLRADHHLHVRCELPAARSPHCTLDKASSPVGALTWSSTPDSATTTAKTTGPSHSDTAPESAASACVRSPATTAGSGRRRSRTAPTSRPRPRAVPRDSRKAVSKAGAADMPDSRTPRAAACKPRPSPDNARVPLPAGAP